MATIARRLLSPNRKGEQLLIFIIKHGDDLRLDYPSLVRLPTDYWTTRKRVSTKYPDHKDLNAYLDSMEITIRTMMNRRILRSEPINKLFLKMELDDIYHRTGRSAKEKEVEEDKNFFKYCDEFIALADDLTLMLCFLASFWRATSSPAFARLQASWKYLLYFSIIQLR